MHNVSFGFESLLPGLQSSPILLFTQKSLSGRPILFSLDPTSLKIFEQTYHLFFWQTPERFDPQNALDLVAKILLHISKSLLHSQYTIVSSYRTFCVVLYIYRRIGLHTILGSGLGRRLAHSPDQRSVTFLNQKIVQF